MSYSRQNLNKTDSTTVVHIADIDTSSISNRVNPPPKTPSRRVMRYLHGATFILMLALPAVLLAQTKTPSKVLERYAGTWKTTIEWSNPDVAEPIKWDGESTTELIGDNWIASRHLGDYLGMDYDASESMGFDQNKGAWTSIWVDRMQDYVQVMDGSISDKGNLEFSGSVLDDDTNQWLSVTRTDEWHGKNEYTSQFVKKNPEGEVVETLTVTHVKQDQDAQQAPQQQ